MCRTPTPQTGFTLIEILIAGSVLAIALTGYVTGMASHQQLAEADIQRSEVNLVAHQFLERMRQDTDFEGLYEWCRYQMAQAELGNTGGMVLEDGRRARAVTAYYPGFETEQAVDVLVDVPVAEDEDTGAPTLREDVTDDAFQLPADLNGDGTIDSAARDDDYLVLPVIVRFVWRPRIGVQRELAFATWIRGTR